MGGGGYVNYRMEFRYLSKYFYVAYDCDGGDGGEVVTARDGTVAIPCTPHTAEYHTSTDRDRQRQKTIHLTPAGKVKQIKVGSIQNRTAPCINMKCEI